MQHFQTASFIIHFLEEKISILKLARIQFVSVDLACSRMKKPNLFTVFDVVRLTETLTPTENIVWFSFIWNKPIRIETFLARIESNGNYVYPFEKMRNWLEVSDGFGSSKSATVSLSNDAIMDDRCHNTTINHDKNKIRQELSISLWVDTEFFLQLGCFCARFVSPGHNKLLDQMFFSKMELWDVERWKHLNDG